VSDEVMEIRTVAPKVGSWCRVTIETNEGTWTWAGKMMEAQVETETIPVDCGAGRLEYLPGRQHFRLHLVRDR